MGSLGEGRSRVSHRLVKTFSWDLNYYKVQKKDVKEESYGNAVNIEILVVITPTPMLCPNHDSRQTCEEHLSYDCNTGPSITAQWPLLRLVCRHIQTI